MALNAINQLERSGRTAVTGLRVARALLDRSIVQYYSRALKDLTKLGYYRYLARASKPYLKAVARQPTHGWGVSQRMQHVSGGVLEVNQGSLYPALHRLVKRRLLAADWGTSDNGRRARRFQAWSSQSRLFRPRRSVVSLSRVANGNQPTNPCP